MNRSFLNRGRGLAVAASVAVLYGCATPDAPFTSSATVVGKNRDFVVVSAGSNDTLRSLAAIFLGDSERSWVIADFNRIRRVKTGQTVVIPLRPARDGGIFPNGYQEVPILTYHRFVPGKDSCDRLAVSAESFESQLRYLMKRGFTVISFPDFADFMDGRKQLPRKAVILSVDDGYKSVYEVAFPLLKKYHYKATVFVYTDFVGSRAGMDWSEMKEMVRSGLIDIQPHSKSHSNLTLRKTGESDGSYKKRLRLEVTNPARNIKERLGLPIHTFAYPYGAENDELLEILVAEGYRLGATVTRGSNPSFTHPFVLRRSQIYCDDNLGNFAKRLGTFQNISAK